MTCIRCIDKNTIYAADLGGTLMRYKDGRWIQLPQNKLKGDFWGMTIFSGQLYLSAYEGIFILKENELLPVNMNLSRKLSTAYLDANDEVMWSVGQKDIAYTKDGKKWIEVDIPD